jgi:thymidylate synthase (FAD)
MKAEYLNRMGDDLTVVNAARVSFDKESCWENEQWGHDDFEHPNYLKESDKKLIKYLATHNHWTPFSHPQIMIRETVPIFVARQRFKHMVGFTYNEVSRRYVDDEPQFYFPDSWRTRPEGSVKQGSGEGVVESIRIDHLEEEFKTSDLYRDYLTHSQNLYNLFLENGVAPELARMVLPQSMYTSYYVTGSLAAWARAYKQRIDSHAQKEIQDLAKQWDEIIRPLFPVSWEVLTK